MKIHPLLISTLIHLALFIKLKEHIPKKNIKESKVTKVKIKTLVKKKQRKRRGGKSKKGKISFSDLRFTGTGHKVYSKGASISESLSLRERLFQIQFYETLSRLGHQGGCKFTLFFSNSGKLYKKVTKCTSPFLNVNINEELDRLVGKFKWDKMKGKKLSLRVRFDLSTTPSMLGISVIGETLKVTNYGAKNKKDLVMKEFSFVLGSITNWLAIPARYEQHKVDVIKLRGYKNSPYFTQ